MVQENREAEMERYCWNPYTPATPTGEKTVKEDRWVSISEIMTRLKVSRDFVSKNITQNLRDAQRPATGKVREKYLYREEAVRKWLMEHATFTRQTRRVHIPKGENRELFLGKIPSPVPDHRRRNTDEALPHLPYLDERKRTAFSAIEVQPFDFWDEQLYFPKAYSTFTPERCYRDMFLAGAIKIQLGKQKTMFYIPKADNLPPIEKLRKIKIDDKHLPLVPASWVPKVGYR